MINEKETIFDTITDAKTYWENSGMYPWERSISFDEDAMIESLWRNAINERVADEIIETHLEESDFSYWANQDKSVYSASITFNDDPETVIDGNLFSEYGDVPDGYCDDDIFFYGMSRKQAIESIGIEGFEFTILSVSDA